MIQYEGLVNESGDPKLTMPLVASVPPASRKAVARETQATLLPAETKPRRETKPSAETKPKGGRPRKRDVDPWVVERVSKATWHRRQKAAAKP